MARTFEVTATEHEVTVNQGASAELVFTVTNKRDDTVEGRAEFRIEQDAAQSWLSFPPTEGEEPPTEPAVTQQREFDANGTEQIKVAIAVPVDAAPGTYEFRLAVADAKRPAADWTESAAVTIEVATAVVEKEDKPFPWWIVGVAAGAVVLIVGVSILIWQLTKDDGPPKKPGLHAKCTDECAAELVCVPKTEDENYCLRVPGVSCDTDDECDGVCTDHVCVGLGGLGEQCEPGDACDGDLLCRNNVCLSPPGAPCALNEQCADQLCLLDPEAPGDQGSTICFARPDPGDECLPGDMCSGGLVCDGGRCLGPDGYAPCNNNAECATNYCAGGTCQTPPGIGDACDPLIRKCPDPLVCNAGTCMLELGKRGCSDHTHCTSGYCKDNVCIQRPIIELCDSAGGCSPGKTCRTLDGKKVCLVGDGGSCQFNVQCASQRCSNGKCRAYTGQCAADTDCRPHQSCAAGRCKLRYGEVCNTSSQCASNFCLNGKCGIKFIPCPKCKRGSVCLAGRCVPLTYRGTVIDKVPRLPGTVVKPRQP